MQHAQHASVTDQLLIISTQPKAHRLPYAVACIAVGMVTLEQQLCTFYLGASEGSRELISLHALQLLSER